jgi:hypothetical protein
MKERLKTVFSQEETEETEIGEAQLGSTHPDAESGRATCPRTPLLQQCHAHLDATF